MIEVDARQAQQIRELVAGGLDPDEAVRKVIATDPDLPPPTVPKKHKYGAIPTEVDGIRFDSKAEARRYEALKEMERRGEIHSLKLQPEYPLHVLRAASNTFVPIGKYVADFAYTVALSGEEVVEDVKGVKTPLYKWKKKHVEAQYGITITEVR